MSYYRIAKPSAFGGKDHAVVHIATGKAVFYGSKRQCVEWIERNGHDEDI